MRDLQAEQDLDRMDIDVPVDYVEGVDLEGIDLENSPQTRLAIDLDRDHVENMRKTLQQGDELPAIIIAPSGRDSGPKYVLLAGKHRLTAMREEGVESSDAYIVRSTSERVHRTVAEVSNVREGKNLSREERKIMAAEYVRTYDASYGKAAELYQLSESNVGMMVRAEQVRDRLEREGIDTEPFFLTTLDKLNRVPAAVREEAAKLIVEHDLEDDSETRDNLLAALVGAETDAEAQEDLDTYRQHLEEAEDREGVPGDEEMPDAIPGPLVVQAKRLASRLREEVNLDLLDHEPKADLEGKLETLNDLADVNIRIRLELEDHLEED